MGKKKDVAAWLRNVCALLLIVIVTITILQVFFRFVLNSPLTWTDELARFLLIWVVFIGAAVVSFDDKHLAVNMFQENMKPKTKLLFDLIMRSVIIVFLVIVTYTSIDVVMAAHYNRSGAMDIPFSYWRAAVPVGGVLMIVYTVIRSIMDIKAYQAGTNEERGINT